MRTDIGKVQAFPRGRCGELGRHRTARTLRRALACSVLLPTVCCPILTQFPAAWAVDTSGAAREAPQAPVPLAEYYKIRRISGASFNHDETLLAYATDLGGRMDVWAAPVSGGDAKQLTRVKGAIEAFEFSAAEDRLVVSADVGGDEWTQLYFTDSKGAELVPLFPDDPKSTRCEFVRWAEDGKSLLYTSNRREAGAMDVYEYDVAGKRSTLAWKSDGKLALVLAGRDLRRFILNEELSDADTNLYLLERGADKPVLLTPHKGEIVFAAMDLSPDGRTLFYTSDEGGEFAALYAMDLATKEATKVLSPPWDVFRASFSRGGKYLVTSVNNDGFPEITIEEAATRKKVTLPTIAAEGFLMPSAFSKSDRFVAGRLENDSAARSLWLLDLRAGTGRVVVDPLPESLKSRRFAAAKSVRVASFDGREVPALLYRPEGDGPFPAVLDIHGGPTSQSVRTFRSFTQYLVSKGYVVLVPNVRGSTGYGKSYTKLDNKDFGGGPLKDVVACKKWLVAHAGVDAERAAIMGQSYGGYMTLAAATFTPTEFAAHVDLFGITDLKSLVESFPVYWASGSAYIYQKFGDPNDPADAKYHRERSPIYFVDRIQRPLLVIQGENDVRVKKEQSDRMVEAVRQRGVPVEYVVIEGEGHGFSKTENQLRAMEAADRFLDEHLWRAAKE